VIFSVISIYILPVINSSQCCTTGLACGRRHFSAAGPKVWTLYLSSRRPFVTQNVHWYVCVYWYIKDYLFSDCSAT